MSKSLQANGLWSHATQGLRNQGEYKTSSSLISVVILPKLQDTRTACGVMYEVVMGIPKSEGMRPPPKIPANPSFVELDEDENAVEKFKKAMANISSILSLDRLKQVCHSLCVYVSLISYHRSLCMCLAIRLFQC